MKGDLLLDLVHRLRPYGLCILHGYRDYPEHIPSDVDVIATERAHARLLELIAQGEYFLVQYLQHEATCHYYVFAIPNERGYDFLQLDLATDYRRNGRVFYTSQDFLESVRLYKGCIPVPPPSLEFGYYLAKRVAKGSLMDRHARTLTNLWAGDRDGCLRELRRLFPASEVGLVARAAETGDWRPVQERLKSLRAAMLRKLRRERSRDVIVYWLGEIRRRFFRIRHPTGLMVAILGPDGAGKSTVIRCIERTLSPAFRRTHRYHLRPNVIWSRRDKSLDTNPHQQPLRNSVLSVVKVLVWWLDYVLGYWLDIYPRLVRSTLVLFDRYYHDLLVDPRRYRYGGPSFFAWLVGRFVPRPQLVILLDAPAEVVYTRKQEVPYEEIERQREAYRRLVRQMPNGYVVDASRSLDKVIVEVERIILRYMADQTARRLGLNP